MPVLQKKYGFTGSLWQGRYKNFPIEKDNYLLEHARYIERNPLRANMVKDISEYPHSSYGYYANGSNDEIIIENIKYEELGRTAAEKQQNYIIYVNEDRFYEKIVDKPGFCNSKIYPEGVVRQIRLGFANLTG